ncbi:MAG: hypothetical protein ABIJ16_07255, partial [Bacteroidota bacterium]
FIEGSKDFILKGKELGLQNKFFVTGTGDMTTSIEIAKQVGAYGIGTSNEVSTAEDVQMAHDAGFLVMMWGEKSRKQNLEAIRKNVDIVQTDKPMHFLKLFGRYNYEYRIP